MGVNVFKIATLIVLINLSAIVLPLSASEWVVESSIVRPENEKEFSIEVQLRRSKLFCGELTLVSISYPKRYQISGLWTGIEVKNDGELILDGSLKSLDPELLNELNEAIGFILFEEVLETENYEFICIADFLIRGTKIYISNSFSDLVYSIPLKNYLRTKNETSNEQNRNKADTHP